MDPCLVPGTSDSRTGTGDHRLLAQLRTEIAGMAVRYDFALVLFRGEHTCDEIPEHEALRPADLDDTVHRRTDRNFSQHRYHVLGEHRLNQSAGRYTNLVPCSSAVGDIGAKLEKLR